MQHVDLMIEYAEKSMVVWSCFCDPSDCSNCRSDSIEGIYRLYVVVLSQRLADEDDHASANANANANTVPSSDACKRGHRRRADLWIGRLRIAKPGLQPEAPDCQGIPIAKECINPNRAGPVSALLV